MPRFAEPGVALVPLSFLSVAKDAAEALGRPANLLKVKYHVMEKLAPISPAASTLAFYNDTVYSTSTVMSTTNQQ